MKKLVAVLICSLAASASAFAGEDSTDHWGPAGTGPSIWESPCGLADFQGNVPMPEKCRPVRSAKPAPSSQAAGTSADQSARYAHSSAAAGATRSDAVIDDSINGSQPAPTLNDSFHYPPSN